jgi:hypothetical protein
VVRDVDRYADHLDRHHRVRHLGRHHREHHQDEDHQGHLRRQDEDQNQDVDHRDHQGEDHQGHPCVDHQGRRYEGLQDQCVDHQDLDVNQDPDENQDRDGNLRQCVPRGHYLEPCVDQEVAEWDDQKETWAQEEVEWDDLWVRRECAEAFQEESLREVDLQVEPDALWVAG